MAYIPDSDFTFDTDLNFQLDAFGRLRTSETGHRLDVEFVYTAQPDFYDTTSGSLGGTITFNTSSRDLVLSVDNDTSGSFSKISSYPVPYTPGNSQLVELTGVLNNGNTVSGSVEVFLRTSINGQVEEEVFSQSQWINLSGNEVDWSKSHIFVMDFQSLRVGSIRFGLNQSGTTVPVYKLDNDNKRNTGYWQIPNLPVFYKAYNDSTHSYSEIGYGDEDNAIGFRYTSPVTGSASVKAICATVKSEGGDDLKDMSGLPRSVDTGIASKTVSTTLIPLISVRSKTLFNGLKNLILGVPKGLTVTTDQPIRYEVRLNPTLTGADWQDVDATESSIESDIAATTITGGTIIYSDFLNTSRNIGTQIKRVLGKEVLFKRNSNLSGILSIAAVRTENSDAQCRAAINWEEIGR